MTEYRTLGQRLSPVQALAQLPDLAGRVVLVTGGTDGVGRALVEQLAGTGATTLLTARSPDKGARVRDEIRGATGNDDVHVIELNLASLASVRAAASTVLDGWDRLDVLIANAGHQANPGRRTVTADGFEMTFGVNHLGHALLIHLLQDRLRASAPSRIVVVASEAHRRAKGGLDFDDLMTAGEPFADRLAYNRSKLANILYVRELARRLDGSGVSVHAAHPGGVDTPMMRANMRGPLKALYPVLRMTVVISADDAASGVLRVALDPELVTPVGGYFENGARKRPNPMAEDDSAAVRLWSLTEELIGTKSDGRENDGREKD